MDFFDIIVKVFAITGIVLLILSFIFPDNSLILRISAALSELITFIDKLIPNSKSTKSKGTTALIVSVIVVACCLIIFPIIKHSIQQSNGPSPIETISESSTSPESIAPPTVKDTEPPVINNSDNSTPNGTDNGVIYHADSNGKLLIQGNKWICTVNNERAVFSDKFIAKKNHTHRLVFKNSNANNKYQVTIYDSRGKEVQIYDVSESGLTVEFKAGETYDIRIEVVQYDCPSEFIIEIKEPDN